MINLSRTILALTLQAALCPPALAQYIDEAAFEELSDQGNAAWEQAQAAKNRNDQAGACTLFSKAANLWTQARTDAPAEYVSAIQNDISRARQAANAFCNVANGTTPFARTDARTDAAFNAQARDVQKGYFWAVEEYRLANRFWEEGNRAAACSKARLAADEMARITSVMRANPEIEAATGDFAKIYQNAQLVTEVRDETFCKGQG